MNLFLQKTIVMKKIISIVLASVMFLFIQTSCTDSSEIDKLVDSQQEKSLSDKYVIGQDEAVTIALDAIGKFDGSHGKGRSVSKSKTVNQVIAYSSEHSRSANISLYIVDFKEGGFAVIPADSRATDVYALSDDGEFDLSNENFSYFMKMAEDYLKEEIDSVSSTESGISIAAEEPNPDFGPEIYAKIEYNGRECYWYSESTQTTPFYLLSTNWNQGEPYRRFCFTDNGENAVAGCVPIAMAQIMAYHKKPESFNGHTYYWNYLTQSSYVPTTSYWADNVAYLVHDIGVNLDVNYGVEGSGATTSNAYLTFKNFGYSASLKNYALNEIISFMDNSRPIYISGTGGNTNTDGSTENVAHAWVLDGYYKVTTVNTYYDVETLDIVYNSNTVNHYLHCNWGWGTGNCYCLSKKFTVYSYDFNNNFNLIYPL